MFVAPSIYPDLLSLLTLVLHNNTACLAHLLLTPRCWRSVTKQKQTPKYLILFFLRRKSWEKKKILADISGAYIPGNVSSFKSKYEHIKVILKKKKNAFLIGYIRALTSHCSANTYTANNRTKNYKAETESDKSREK